jgi:WD repeat-containing protein 40A
VYASSLANTAEVKGGIHAVRINKSGTLLATGGKQSCDVAVYALPTFDPVFVGAGAHEDLIFDITWIDDQLFVSGSRDSTLALWKVSSRDLKFDSDVGPRCVLRAPVKKEKCKMGDKVRTMGFNPKYPEIVAVSMNAYVHVFDPLTLTQVR